MKIKIRIGVPNSSYISCGETMQEWFKAYENDSAKNVEIDGNNYSKIIYWCDFYRNDEKMLLVSIEIGNDCKIGDILVDENGNEFVFRTVEMLKYPSEMPKWAYKVSSILLQCRDDLIGEYLCLKQ